MNKFKTLLFCLGFLGVMAMPLVGMAYQPQDITFDPNDQVRQESRLGNASPVATAANLINWGLGILGLFFLVLMLWGGFIWMNARGNEEEVGKAKKIITSAVIGLVIILASYGTSYYVFENLVDATSW